MTGCPVRVPVSSEAAALGAALQGLWLMEGGNISSIITEHIGFDDSKATVPDKERHELYMELYGRWQRLVDASLQMYSV